tara:strand:- start:1023 stop:1172 length:150 start_codon:yes stop_codon:yes gene_type:complete
MLNTNNSEEVTYQEFQEWLDDCPTKILRYEDMIDAVELLIEMPIKEEKV